MFTNGHITLKRKIKEKGWYHNVDKLAVMIHLLMDANFEDQDWDGFVIKRGQVYTSVSEISRDCGISVQKVRTAIKSLIASGEVKTKTTKSKTLVTICNYDSYQFEQQAVNKQLTSEQQADNKQLTSKQQLILEKGKEGKKENKETFSPEVEEIYAAYPTTCPFSGRKTGKDIESKRKITRMMRSWTKEQILAEITTYLSDCDKTRTYIKNFLSLLNTIDRSGVGVFTAQLSSQTKTPSSPSSAPPPSPQKLTYEEATRREIERIRRDYPTPKGRTDEEWEYELTNFIIPAQMSGWEDEWRARNAK